MIEVIGIDPSLTATGVCLPDGTCTTIKTGGAHRGDQRLHDLRRAMRYYLRAWPARLAVIEVPGQFRSGDAALAAGMVQGVIREILVEFQLPFGKIHLTKVKQFATGKGDADKATMVAAANRHRDADPLTDDNQADAWWLRQIGLWHLGEKTLDPSQDEWLNPHLLRDEIDRNPKGAKWPGR